ncbi:MAG: aminopeptidase [Lachnospiraceae bacterium]
MIELRLELAKNRLKEILNTNEVRACEQEYFKQVVSFILMILEEGEWLKSKERECATFEELQSRNQRLYQELMIESYQTSYANPEYATLKLGEELGPILSALYAEMFSLISYVYDQKEEECLIRIELCLEIYGMFVDEAREEKTPKIEFLKQAFYWFAYDYATDLSLEQIKMQYVQDTTGILSILEQSKSGTLEYLFQYGEYIGENELKMAQYLLQMEEEKIQKIADTYTNGYKLGFEATGKDLSIKKTVAIHYFIGFERVVVKAIDNFKKMGLESICYKAPASFINGRRVQKAGVYSTSPNKQFDYDHEYDKALYFSTIFINKKLESLKAAFEQYKEETSLMGGPAVIEEFGEVPFTPMVKKENLRFSKEQQKLFVTYQSKARDLLSQYVKSEERSFTIIAFPIPAIGEQFEEIFSETVLLNTLDYKKYETIQQTIIDTLDQGEFVHIIGCNGNKTQLCVALHDIKSKDTETGFENCVADVNIPVGEVFTSPKLEGTKGILHVKEVFLHGLKYKDLMLTFDEGMVGSYSCSNFEKEEENKAFIKENLLHMHETLPLGEFAIGTNTTAYVVAKKYKIEDVLPILIAEKMGPHFAVGDTCYSREEASITKNPNGKIIIAKENSISAKKEYYNCHTDITIPYDELGELFVTTKAGEKIEIIKNGKFILKDCEELNKPFDE